MRSFSSVASGLLLTSFVAAAPSATPIDTCKEIEASISSASAVFYPGTPEYVSDMTHAYLTSSQNSTCSAQPGTAADAAKMLSIIGAHQTPYAVKSGGHTTNPGFSSTTGVLITTLRLNHTSYDPETNVASIGPGQTSERVYHALEPYNVSVALGRVAEIGVGGFTLGGGYSWLTQQVGLSCDTVVEFEVALTNGSVVRATNQTNSDLFFGLKGGGNNFGVVTNIHYTAVEQPAVWGGERVYTGAGNISKVIQAVSDFQDSNTNPKAVVGVTFGYDPSYPDDGINAVLFFYYHGPTPPNGTYDQFLAIPSTGDDLTTTSLYTKISGLIVPFSDRGLWRSVSVSNYTVPVLNQITSLLKTHGADAFENHSATLFTMAVEPLMTNIFDHQPNGLAAYVHTPGTFFAPSVSVASWGNSTDDDYFFNVTKQIASDTEAFAASPEGGLQPTEPPTLTLYPNYASYDTNTSYFFGDNMAQLIETQKKYDPQGVTNLTTGYKFAL